MSFCCEIHIRIHPVIYNPLNWPDLSSEAYIGRFWSTMEFGDKHYQRLVSVLEL